MSAQDNAAESWQLIIFFLETMCRRMFITLFSFIYFLLAIFQAITTCLGMMHAGVYDVCLAGGVEFMSDVPIRHSRKMRAWMLASQKQKGPAKMLGHISKLR